jgi:hypothetical protein
MIWGSQAVPDTETYNGLDPTGGEPAEMSYAFGKIEERGT